MLKDNSIAPHLETCGIMGFATTISFEASDEVVLEEVEKRWILNLSMHFRDKSKREDFFVHCA